MQTIDLKGAKLDSHNFVSIYGEARKLAPTRFLTIEMHPLRQMDLMDIANMPESIQYGSMAGNLGKQVVKVACVKPLNGLAGGITLVPVKDMAPNQIVVKIHGVVEIMVVNVGASHESTSQSNIGPSLS